MLADSGLIGFAFGFLFRCLPRQMTSEHGGEPANRTVHHSAVIESLSFRVSSKELPDAKLRLPVSPAG